MEGTKEIFTADKEAYVDTGIFVKGFCRCYQRKVHILEWISAGSCLRKDGNDLAQIRIGYGLSKVISMNLSLNGHLML